MAIEIKSRWSNTVLYRSEKALSIAEALEEAIHARANLDGANLYGANLSRANLDGANLDGANLYGANLYGANLSRANLDGANLDGANLSRANLSRANLSRANLSRANLYGATGINPRRVQPLLMLLNQPGKQIAYKLVKSNGDSPTCHLFGKDPINYVAGKKISVNDADEDVNTDCGAGVNVATLDWILKNFQKGKRIFEIEFTASDIAAIPTTSDGKFRLHRCKVVREVTLDELGIDCDGKDLVPKDV